MHIHLSFAIRAMRAENEWNEKKATIDEQRRDEIQNMQ